MCQEPTELLLIGCFDRIYWDPKIQIRYIDTKHHIADMLTKGIFTRDEWNNLLHLFNISHSSSLSAVLRISAWSAAPKRWRRGCKNQEKITGLWQHQSQRRWTWPSLSRQVLHLWTVLSHRSPGILKVSSRLIGHSGKPGVRSKRNSNPDAASSSQGSRKDALLDGRSGKPVATEKDQESLNYPETVCTGKLVAHQDAKDIQETQELQEIQKTRKPTAEFGHTMSLYHQTVYLTWRKSSRLWDKLMAKVRRSERPWREHSYTVYTYVCHTSNCSSSWAKIIRIICNLLRINP